MEFKGTKGNWEVMPKARFNVQNKQGYCVASCGGRSSNIEDLTEELLANAKLIAAAPELLEALQEVIKLQEDNYGNGMNTHMRLKSLCDNKLKKIINKAL